MYAYFMCSFACSGFGVSYPHILAGYGHSWVGCKLNSIAVLFPATSNQSIRVCGGKSKWSFLLVISICCKTVTEKFESMSISRSADAEKNSRKMLEIWLSSCSSHYVECTKTWLRGFSSVCESFQQSVKPHSYCRSQPDTSKQSSNAVEFAANSWVSMFDKYGVANSES